MTAVYIGLAGIAGALARFGISLVWHGGTGSFWPWGTLLCNWAGSLLLGVLSYSEQLARRPRLRLALTTGLLGSFTTFSTFSWELFQFIQQKLWLQALGYGIASVSGGLLFVHLGRRMKFRRRKRGNAE